MLRKIAFVAATAFGLVFPAVAQQIVRTAPITGSFTNAAGTIAVTNTFQAVWATQSSRQACWIENTGTNPMYVFVGALADATAAKSFKITAGNMFVCTISGVVTTDAISITGTATETFAALV